MSHLDPDPLCVEPTHPERLEGAVRRLLIDDGYLVEPDEPRYRLLTDSEPLRPWFGCVVLLTVMAATFALGVLVGSIMAATPRAAAQSVQTVLSEPLATNIPVPRALVMLERTGMNAGVPLPPFQTAAVRPSPGAAERHGPPAAAVTYTGTASWFPARGFQGAVPWWKAGQRPVWATVSRFADGRTYSVTVLVTGFCQCLQGQPGERVIDLSDDAFRQLAPLSAGLIRVTLEVGTAGPPLPATSTGGTE